MILEAKMIHTNEQLTLKYQDVIKKRNITQLCHFTKSANLPGILSYNEGILSTDKINNVDNEIPQDKNRFDNDTSHVCTSVQNINKYYFKNRVNKSSYDLLQQWAVLLIDPKIIDYTTDFCPVNAATKMGKYIIGRGKNEKKRYYAFDCLFDQIIYSSKGKKLYRNLSIPKNNPTDVQAEILISDNIPRKDIIGIAFPKKNIDMEIQRLKLWLDDVIINNLKITTFEEQGWNYNGE
ncbi:DUF4433 domain-containing protein [Apilactobacillus timberlakei]|nr:DUF4433 domain-containing protein [Apilactobacillus timberlakei]